MMRLIFTSVAFAATFAGIGAAPDASWAQSYPSRPITMVVPFAAGGPVDVLARIMAERMKASLGQPVIIENVAGAAGSVGVGRVARAPADGYTLSIGPGSSTHVVNAAIYALPYDVVKDFEPISLIGSMSELVVARKTMPASDLDGLIAWLKANPDKASQATSGVGSAGHVAGVFFQKVTGTRFGFVPYRGLAPAMQDLLAGQVDHDDRRPDELAAAGARRRDQGLCGHRQEPDCLGARNPDGGRGRTARVPRVGWYALWASKGTPRT